MEKFDIKGDFLVTAKVKAQMDEFPVVSPIPDNLMNDNFQSFVEATSQSTDKIKQNTAIYKEFGDVLPEVIKNLRYMNSAVAQTTAELPSIIKKNITSDEKIKGQISEYQHKNLVDLLNLSGNIIQQGAYGNSSGVANTLISGAQNILNNSKNVAKIKDEESMMELFTKIGFGTMIAGTIVKTGDVLANKFIDEMPNIYSSGRIAGSMSDEDSMIAYQRLNEKNRGTGLDVGSFISVAETLNRQGLGLIDAGNIGQLTSQWAYQTGGDANQYANLAGLMSRYGGSINVAEDFNHIVSAGYASGLNSSQIPEFLTSIQKVMEDGIAKGFSRSATEVADTLLMFSKMSGNNAFWQGEQGAKIINQANAGLSGATGMSKTSDIIAYRAIAKAYNSESSKEASLGKDLYLSDGNYVNNMMLLEQGLNANNFGAIMEAIAETSPSTEGKIERLRQMFGVNYTGAARLLNLDYKNMSSPGDLQKAIDDIQKSPENRNEETRYQQSVNDIKVAVADIGSGAAKLKIDGMELISSSVKNIEKFLLGDADKKEEIKNLESMLDNLDEYKGKILEDNFNYFSDDEKSAERIKSLVDWNGFGRVPGLPYGGVFTMPPTSPDIKYGETWEDIPGSWGVIDISNKNMSNFLKEGFGNEILNAFNGDEKAANEFIMSISDSKNKNTENFRAMISNYSLNNSYTPQEQQDTLNKILELLKEGINVNENN